MCLNTRIIMTFNLCSKQNRDFLLYLWSKLQETEVLLMTKAIKIDLNKRTKLFYDMQWNDGIK